MTNNQSSLQFFQQVFGGAWITQGIWVAAELGIADLLAHGPQTVEALAEQTRTHPRALHRLLRALASVGIFAQDAHDQFSLTPHADLLRSNVVGSQRSFATMMGAEFHATWGELLYSVQTGEQGFQKRFGAPFFQYMMEHPERHGIYDNAMTGVHGSETEPMIDAYDFSTFRTVVDIGGGNGLMLAAILNRYPTVHGLLFDLPAVVDRARPVLSDTGLSSRCQLEGGDFFSSVPANADVYVLRHILHDWEDNEAITILRNCREAMNDKSRILVIETVIPTGNDPCFGKWLDLMMLLVGGRERTAEEYRRLFSAAGLTLNRIVSTAAEISVIEGMRAV